MLMGSNPVKCTKECAHCWFFGATTVCFLSDSGPITEIIYYILGQKDILMQ